MPQSSNAETAGELATRRVLLVDDDQTIRDVLTEALGVQPAPDWLVAYGRTLRVGAFPIGIDAADFARMMRSAKARRMRA